MSCALAAFFGVPLGGSLFALEINNRMGIEYYEHVVESIFSGTVCLCVFRGLTGQSFGAIWDIEPGQELDAPTPSDVILGAVVGLFGATVAWLFASFHKFNMGFFNKMGLLDENRTVQRALLGASVMLTIGVLIPRTMFWGEEEFNMIATAAPASELPNVWPTNGLLGLEIVGFWSAMLVGVAKMVAISYTVAAGYRGGFIFPFFAAGAAFGKGITFLLPSLSPTIMTLCFAAGINVAITRTALATTLILCALAGEINAGPPVLAASMISLLSTSYMVSLQ
jgi:H+/Cl- antiporter ClcA